MISFHRSRFGRSGKQIDALVAHHLAKITPEIERKVREIAREAAVELANATFPKGGSPDPLALAAIAKDVRRVFMTAGKVYSHLRARHGRPIASAFYRAAKSGNRAAALKVLREAGGDFARLEFGPVSRSLHEAARSGPRRRVTLRFPIRIVPDADLAAYIVRVQKGLGEAASGWAACAAKLGGETGISSWKTTGVHGSQFGSVRPMQGTRIGFILRNTAPHAPRNLPASEANAIAIRASKRLIERLARK